MSKIKFFPLIVSVLFFLCYVSCKKEDDKDKTDNILLIQKNKERGETYLKEKSKEDGVKTDPSGLLYRVLEPTDGKKPGQKDTVAFHYEGFILTGKSFIEKDARSAMEDLNSAFYIGLRHMNEGSTYRLYVPYYLMYGATQQIFIKRTESGVDTIKILDYSALYYDIKLDSITFVE